MSPEERREQMALVAEEHPGTFDPGSAEFFRGACLQLHSPGMLCILPVGHDKRKAGGGIRRTSADARFSTMIRERDKWTCQRCGKVYEPPTSALHAMHMFSRRIKATRLDPENAAAGCYGCHQFLDSHPNEKLAFFRARLGDEAFDALAARAHAKRDRSVSS